MTAAVEPRADLPALTGARGIAAWFVVLYHVRLSAEPYLAPGVSALLAKGYLAVDFFFILSGFVIYLNYGDRIRRDGAGAVPKFIARRIARIWPLHLFILAGAAAFAAVLWTTGSPGAEEFPWAELPLHILLVHNWGFTSELNWNDPSWSISGELAAYLLFPLLVLAVDWRRLPTFLLFLIALLAAAALHAVFAAMGADILDRQIPRLGIFRALLEFFIGLLLCVVWRRHCGGALAPALAAAALILAAAAWAGGIAGETAAAPAMLAALLLVLAFTADRRWNPLASTPVHYLGEISYSTYLVHFLWFIVFKILFVEQARDLPPALLGLFLASTLAASILLYHGVERPAQRALNRSFDIALERIAARRERSIARAG